MDGRQGSLCQTPSGSFVANCLKYETVRSCFSEYRIIYEALTALRADLGRYGAWAPSPGIAPAADSRRGQRPAPVCPGLAPLKALGLRRIAVVRPTDPLGRAAHPWCRWLSPQLSTRPDGASGPGAPAAPRGTGGCRRRGRTSPGY